MGLLTWLLLLSACLTLTQTYRAENRYSNKPDRNIPSADYNRLLNLLYRRYKSYKQDGVSSLKDDKTLYRTGFITSSFNKRSLGPVLRGVTHGRNIAQKRSALRKAIQSMIRDVTSEEVALERKALRDRKAVNGEKRDTVV